MVTPNGGKKDVKFFEETELTVKQALVLGYLKRNGEQTVKALREGIKTEQGFGWSRTGFLNMARRLDSRGLVAKLGQSMELTKNGEAIFAKLLDRLRWGFKGLKETPRPQETRRAFDDLSSS